jgi:hypothetical protein
VALIKPFVKGSWDLHIARLSLACHHDAHILPASRHCNGSN